MKVMKCKQISQTSFCFWNFELEPRRTYWLYQQATVFDRFSFCFFEGQRKPFFQLDSFEICSLMCNYSFIFMKKYRSFLVSITGLLTLENIDLDPRKDL